MPRLSDCTCDDPDTWWCVAHDRSPAQCAEVDALGEVTEAGQQ